MLILSRKKNEAVVINENIIITVVEIRGDKVRLGVRCPREMPCHRQEVYEAIHGTVLPAQPRSPEEAAFVQAVCETPDDIGVRLIFADWLDDHDDPYGEFIRVQCRLADDGLTDAERTKLLQREAELFVAHGERWRQFLPEILRSSSFRRGFVEEVRTTVDRFLLETDALFAAAPVRRLAVEAAWYGSLSEQVIRLAESPHLRRLSHLSFAGLGIGDAEASALASSPHVGGLVSLDLSRNRINDEGGLALARGHGWDALEELLLTANPAISTPVRALLQQQFGERVRF